MSPITRRDFLRYTAAGAVSFALSGALNTKEKPNVLVIISDDQGFGDFHSNGNDIVRTPSLDHLAAESAVYRNFVVAPACSPSRSALFTGRDHLLTGVWGVPPRANLLPDETRMPAFFKAHGYKTCHIGKLDCVRIDKENGADKFGWDDHNGLGAYEHHNPRLLTPGRYDSVDGWTADIWTDAALDFVGKNRSDPWFLSLAYIIPHMPWVCDERYRTPFLEAGHSKEIADCYGSISQMDACIGRLLDGLRASGQEENTIVVFTSDNGPSSKQVPVNKSNGFVTNDDWKLRNCTNLRGMKAMVWENGIKVPLFVRWPKHIPPGERIQFASVEDILPTVLDLAHISHDSVRHQPFTGTSIVHSLENPASLTDHADVHRIAIAGPGSPIDLASGAVRHMDDHHIAARGSRFKYHALPKGESMLFDLAADPGETTDVSSLHPDVTLRMAGSARRWWNEVIASGRAFRNG